MLPSLWRNKAGVGAASELRAIVTEDGSLILETRAQGVKRAQALVRRYIPGGVNLSEDLIRERKAEAARESIP